MIQLTGMYFQWICNSMELYISMDIYIYIYICISIYWVPAVGPQVGGQTKLQVGCVGKLLPQMRQIREKQHLKA